MTNSEKVKSLVSTMNVETLQTQLQSELDNQNFDFQTKLEWEGNKAKIYVEEKSTNENTAFTMNVIEFELN
jgi:hypothetical protein